MLEKSPEFSLSAKLIKHVTDPDLEKLLKKINDHYYYWDRIKYQKTKLSPVELWSVVKFSRMAKRSIITFGDTMFCYAITDYIQRVLHEFDMNIGGYMGATSVVPEKDKTRYLVSSIMEEAISSSQMEGANTTRKRAKEMLRKEQKPNNKSEQMIVNNYLTIKHIVANKNDELTPESLLYLHQLVSNKTLDKKEDEGAFRSSNDIYIVNHVNSEVVHTPPDHQKIERFIKDLCFFFNNVDENDFVHPLIKGIIIHFMIGWIHPFTDGNGRTARALFYWYLLKKGYWLTEYMSVSKIIQTSKAQYEKAYLYTEEDENDLSYFITYNLQVMEKAFEALKNYIQSKQQENLQIAHFVKIPFVNERQAQILKAIYDNAEIVFNTKEIQNRFTVSDYTARTDLNGLVDLGYLAVVQVNKVKRNYVKSEQFSALLKKNKID